VRRIVHYFPGAMGNSGVTFALWSWARAQAASGAEVCVLHAASGEPSSDVAFVSKDCRAGLTRQCVPHRGRHRMTLRPVGLHRYLGRNDLLVLHTGWVPSNLIAASAAERANVPYVVMPHGVYERMWTTYLNGPRLVRDYFERRLLERAAAVHLFFDSEVADVLALAPAARCITVPTGFDVPPDHWSGGGGYLGWIGRVDPVHKGLDALVGAVSELSPPERPFIRICGYDYKGGIARLGQLIARLGLAKWIQLEGAIAGTAKATFMQRADGYLHPSRWECHSIALLENLALGVPSLVSRSIHIAPTLERSNAAVLALPREADLADALRRLPSERLGVAARARELIAGAFNWNTLMPQFDAALGRLGLS
jgi:glycosyltransferase involved in cell wall biosynthesis